MVSSDPPSDRFEFWVRFVCGAIFGTLLAFVIVSAGVWALRVKRPDLPRPFKAPLIWKSLPLTPLLGMGISLGLMASLPWSTWLRLIAWLIVGMLIYFGYGRSHSKLRTLTPK